MFHAEPMLLFYIGALFCALWERYSKHGMFPACLSCLFYVAGTWCGMMAEISLKESLVTALFLACIMGRGRRSS